MVLALRPSNRPTFLTSSNYVNVSGDRRSVNVSAERHFLTVMENLLDLARVVDDPLWKRVCNMHYLD